MLKLNRIVVMNNNESPARKIISAALSNRSFFLSRRLIERKDRKQLVIKNRVATVVI